MRKSLRSVIMLVSLLTLATVGWAQIITITGSQIHGKGTTGTLESTPVTLPNGGVITGVVVNQGDCFWLEGPTGTKQFASATAGVAYVLAPGSWRAFPCLAAGQDRASVTVTINGPPSKTLQPNFGPLDAGGMPCFLHEVSPHVKTAAYILKANTPYTVWAAPVRKGQPFDSAAWRPFGPWKLAGRERYIFNWDGAVWGGNLANDPLITGIVLSPALASLSWQNNDSENVWLIVNPLPPGGCSGAGESGAALEVSIIPPQETVEQGGTLTLTARTVGGTPPYSFQWFEGNKESKGTSASITWSNLRKPGPRTFKVIVTDAAGSKAEAQSSAVVVQAEVNPATPATPEVTPTVPSQPSTPSTTPTAGHWERGDPIITWDPPTSNEGGQAKKLAEQPYAGAHWLSADGWSNTIETIGSNHVVASAQAPPNFSYRYDLSWTEPPRILNAGQMVQFQTHVGDRGGVTLYEYEGTQTNNRNLVHGGTNSAAPFKIPAVSTVNSDVSKAEFGFFVGAGGTPLKYVYTYHWAGGAAAALPAPAKQTYTGRFRNSEGGTGSAKLMIEESNGTVQGEWDGDAFTGLRTGNVVTFEIPNVAGCRDYQVRVEFTGVGDAATVTYNAHDRCRQPATYSGTEQLTRQ